MIAHALKLRCLSVSDIGRKRIRSVFPGKSRRFSRVICSYLNLDMFVHRSTIVYFSQNPSIYPFSLVLGKPTVSVSDHSRTPDRDNEGHAQAL